MKATLVASALLMSAAGAAWAAPTGVGVAGASAKSPLQSADYRACYYHNGVRHCRWVDDDYAYDDYDDGYWGVPGFAFSFGGGPRFGGHGGGHGHGGHGHR